MPQPDEKIERLLAKLLADFTPSTINPELPPIPEHATDGAAAIARCREAWQQAFDRYMAANAAKEGRLAEPHAAREAAAAYRAALPPLRGNDSIGDFIACVAYGILIDAVPKERGGQLLYAAQVALSALARTPQS
jgi:hypothetical protein